MWIMTTGGFVSAVQHRDDPTLVVVRGRDKKSLETMIESIMQGTEGFDPQAEGHVPYQTAKSDYAWRVIITKQELVAFTAVEIMSFLNYGNFKSAATAHLGEAWHEAYMDVWTAMLGIQTGSYERRLAYKAQARAKKHAFFDDEDDDYTPGGYNPGGWSKPDAHGSEVWLDDSPLPAGGQRWDNETKEWTGPLADPEGYWAALDREYGDEIFAAEHGVQVLSIEELEEREQADRDEINDPDGELTPYGGSISQYLLANDLAEVSEARTDALVMDLADIPEPDDETIFAMERAAESVEGRNR